MDDLKSNGNDDQQTPGPLLKAARQARGLELQAVADDLRLLSSYVEALEADDYSYFRAPIFTKGYLRSYAKLLGLDTAQLLALYDRKMAEVSADKIEGSAIEKSTVSIKGAGWLVATIVVALAIILFSVDGEEGDAVIAETQTTAADASVDEGDAAELADSVPTVEPVPQVMEEEVTEPLVDAGATLDLLNDEAPVEIDEVVNPLLATVGSDRAEVDTSGIDSGDTELNLSVSNESVASAADDAEPDSSPVPLNGAQLKSVEFRFSGDCWIKVSDSTGLVLVADLKRDQDIVTVEGVPPFSVMLGYAPAVSVLYNDEPVSFRVRSDNTARLTIGDS